MSDDMQQPENTPATPEKAPRKRKTKKLAADGGTHALALRESVKQKSEKFLADYVEGTKLLMYCFTGDYKGTPLPMAEIEELVYLDADDIGRGRTTPMGEKILNHLAEENLIGPFWD